MAVIGVVADGVMDDQAAFHVHDALEIVGRQLRRMAVTNRLGFGLAEDEHFFVPVIEFSLTLGKPILSTLQRSDRSSERLPVNGLIRNPLRGLLVHDIKAVKIVRDLAFGVDDVARQAFSAGDVLRTGDGPDLSPVERDRAAADQALLAAELHEGGAGPHDCLRVVVPERGDGAVIWGKAAHQPQRLQIADAGALQHPRRAQLVEIAPDVETQHVAWSKAGPAGCGGHRPVKAELGEVEAVDKGVDNAHQRIKRDIVLDARRQQTGLSAVLTFNEARRRSPRMRDPACEADSGPTAVSL
jgi:hypothetical protein